MTTTTPAPTIAGPAMPAPAMPSPLMPVHVARRRLLAHRIVYTVLVLNFFIPALSYIFAPHLAEQSIVDINTLLGGMLGGTAWPTESGELWHMLAVGNVMTLAFMCLLLLVDLERFYPVLPALAFLKGHSALYSLGLGVVHDLPGFFGVFLLDGSTTVAMLFFAIRARAAISALPPEERPLAWYVHVVLLWPRRVQAGLARVQAAGLVDNVPNLFQVSLGCLRMWLRLVFRSDTVGTCHDPVRDSWRAKLLHWRLCRLPFLLWEQAIAPLDMSGLCASRERIIRHLLLAHHDGDQFAYDLELLQLFPGALEELRERTQAVLVDDTPRHRWMRDLVVHAPYHQQLLHAVDRALGGNAVETSDPDITLRAFLTWCAAQPATPTAWLSSWASPKSAPAAA